MKKNRRSQNIFLREFEEALQELNRTSFGRRTFLAAIPILLAACASQTKQTLKGEDHTLNVDDEKLMAHEALPEMRRDYPALHDADVQSYISELGARLVAKNDLAGHPYDYTFTVVDVPMVNAFALPAGTVFVTVPLLQVAESEAELAGVLGHEIGHVRARHAALRIAEQEKAREQSWWYTSGGAVAGGIAGAGIASLACPGGMSGMCTAELIAFGAAAGVNGGLLIQKYKFLAHTRENELEADRIGFATALQAGYSANHIGDFYSRLQKMEEEHRTKNMIVAASLADAISTHPPSAERVQQIHDLVSRTTPNSSATFSSAKFDQIRKRVEELQKPKKS